MVTNAQVRARSCSICAWRRTELTIRSRAPCGRLAYGSVPIADDLAHPGRGSAHPAHPPASACRRARSRAGRKVSRSFSECTAKSMRRSSSASWISFENRPLPPISARRWPLAWEASPVVRIACSWNTSMPRSTGQNLVSVLQERPRLHQGQRRGAGADPQRQPRMVRPDVGVVPAPACQCDAGIGPASSAIVHRQTVHRRVCPPHRVVHCIRRDPNGPLSRTTRKVEVSCKRHPGEVGRSSRLAGATTAKANTIGKRGRSARTAPPR